MPQDGSVVVEKVKRSAHKVVLGWSDERGGARETHGWLGAGDNKEPKEDKWCVFEAEALALTSSESHEESCNGELNWSDELRHVDTGIQDAE